jgi:PncC family amidohydrolase
MTTPDEDIARVVARKVIHLLTLSKTTLAVAESSTGGLIGHLLTEVDGCSEVFVGGMIAYDNSMKEKLEVPKETIDREGAVSAATAEAMARGVRQQTKADIGLAVTGIAGANGGTAAKPAGLTYFALADAKGIVRHQEIFKGDRSTNKIRSAEMGLRLVFNRVAER